VIELDHASFDRILPASAGTADWDDVLGRTDARRGRRPLVAAFAVILLVAVVSASALAMRALLSDRGFVGLPPKGAIASSPERGKVVLRARGRCAPGGYFCFVWAYRDGRLIWIRDAALPYGANTRTTGLLVQRLAPKGLKLLRSAFVATGECDSPTTAAESIDCFPVLPGPAPFPALESPGWQDTTWGLPASAWRDPEITAFVPARFAACFVESYRASSDVWQWRKISAARVLTLLPPRAANLLRGRDAFGDVTTCFALTTKETRKLAGIFDGAGVRRLRHERYVLEFQIPRPHGVREEIWFAPMLPNGEWVRTGGG